MVPRRAPLSRFRYRDGSICFDVAELLLDPARPPNPNFLHPLTFPQSEVNALVILRTIVDATILRTNLPRSISPDGDFRTNTLAVRRSSPKIYLKPVIAVASVPE